jgi:glutaredoxin-related protein
LKFTESSSANWKATDFIGRPEPVYTYNNTSRSGTLSWKIVVDHPSVLNVIVNKVLANENNKVRVDSILESFFAGCRKYDLYDLAKKYYTVNPNDILEIQKELQTREVPVERIKYLKQQLTTNIEGSTTTTKGIPDSLPTLEEYIGIGGYFENDIPSPANTKQNFKEIYPAYVSPTNQKKYKDKNASTEQFFSTVVTPNYNKLNELAIQIGDLLTKYPGEQNIITLTINGNASAPAGIEYNIKLSKRRIDSIIQFFKEHDRTKNFCLDVDGKNTRLKLISGKEEGETGNSKPIQYVNGVRSVGEGGQCSDETGGDDRPPKNDVYTTRAMGCRRATISRIVVGIKPDPPEDTVTTIPPSSFTTEVDVPQTSIDTVTVTDEIERTVIRDNISKRVLRSLLTECDYFETIKEETPMVYDNLREKLKFFNPAFHSTTPEGLNARLTFLQQCLRPGDTIPVIQAEGKLEYNNATNTAFGAPPVLILRVGDFYHSKIIPDGLQLTFEGLDLNPEGIGIQPMIANVSMNFKFVGGQGLASAVDRLQNALTFNYYANTEMYDDRADVTDTSYQVIDKDLLDYFNIDVPPPNIKLAPTPQTSTNNQTIGTILSATTTESGETGSINYQLYMNGFIQTTQDYFTNVVNKNKEIFTQYNNAVRQVWSQDRNYTLGFFEYNKSKITRIFGKPKDFEKKTDKIFNDYITNINNEEVGLIKFIKGTPENPKNFSDKVVRALKENYKKTITEYKGTFQSSATKITQDFVNIQQLFINNIAKNNVVLFDPLNVSGGTDGYQQPNGYVVTYRLSSTTKTFNTKYSTTYGEIFGDTNDINEDIIDFYEKITEYTSFNYGGPQYNEVLVYGEQKIDTGKVFQPLSPNLNFQDVIFQREYFILNQEIINDTKYNTFKQKVIGSILTNKSLFAGGQDDLEKQFDAYYKNTVKPAFQSENEIINKFFQTIETEKLKGFLNYVPFEGSKQKKYEFSYELEPKDVSEKVRRDKLIKALGVSDNEFKTFNNWADEKDGLAICKVKLN